jgi:hypothetical protein
MIGSGIPMIHNSRPRPKPMMSSYTVVRLLWCVRFEGAA